MQSTYWSVAMIRHGDANGPCTKACKAPKTNHIEPIWPLDGQTNGSKFEEEIGYCLAKRCPIRLRIVQESVILLTLHDACSCTSLRFVRLRCALRRAQVWPCSLTQHALHGKSHLLAQNIRILMLLHTENQTKKNVCGKTHTANKKQIPKSVKISLLPSEYSIQ